ncbi:MAG TPA: chemotaxis protein CheW [Chroococcales cyanobacterium]|jgi:purine-binding chemotaxis protein CheW
MSNPSISFQADSSELSLQTRQATPYLKLIVFSLGNLNLALRIEAVYKVVNRTPVHSSGVGAVGVAHVGDGEVTVVDLHRRFFNTSNLSSEFQLQGYLVVVRSTTGELYGIPIADTPVLMEVPLSQIRLLPESYRRSDTLEVASHVAVIPQENSQLTIFLLDADRLLPLFRELAAVEQYSVNSDQPSVIS